VGKREMGNQFWSQNLKIPEDTKDTSWYGCLGADGRIIIKWILDKENGKVWTELDWPD
jgi:hypothetical protein